MLERDIERHLGEMLRAMGCLYWKFESPGNIGVPDRIVVIPGGFVIFAELKAEDGRLSALQNQKIDQLRARGADVRVIKGWEEARLFAREVNEWCSIHPMSISDSESRPL